MSERKQNKKPDLSGKERFVNYVTLIDVSSHNYAKFSLNFDVSGFFYIAIS